ncbi:MAG: aminodeoxychorismate lyase [Microbacteriaceae bacterium]
MATAVLAILNAPTSARAHVEGAPPFSFVDAHAAQLSVLDLAATRGDGIFEAIGIGNGHPQAIDAHLARFTRSAAALDLPAPDTGAWRSAIAAVASALDPAPESWVKLVLSRGIEGENRPTGWVYGAHSPDYSAEREEGIKVVLLDRGYRHDVASTSPWLLAGAKTLSYAVNRAVLREAARREADDVIFVSSDGYVLEGPTSTVIVRHGDTLLTPSPSLGILEGTTQASIFAWAAGEGFECRTGVFGPASVREADAVWLVSSLRLAAPVRSVDGTAVAVDAALTKRINTHLGALRA